MELLVIATNLRKNLQKNGIPTVLGTCGGQSPNSYLALIRKLQVVELRPYVCGVPTYVASLRMWLPYLANASGALPIGRAEIVGEEKTEAGSPSGFPASNQFCRD